MSKPVRLPDYLYAEVERLAKEERRSLANMVQVLLEQSLKLDNQPISKETVVLAGPSEFVHVTSSTTPKVERQAEVAPSYFPEREVKPDFKGKK